MKVKVYYMDLKSTIVEVDNKYEILRDPNHDQDCAELVYDLDLELYDTIDPNGEIIAVWTEDDQECLYEN